MLDTCGGTQWVRYIFMKISHNLNYRPPVKTIPKAMSKQPSLLGISIVGKYRDISNPTLAAIMVQGAAELELIMVKHHLQEGENQFIIIFVLKIRARFLSFAGR